jgi:hypothetical protein
MRSSRVLTCVSWLVVVVGCSSSSGGQAGKDSGANEASLEPDSEGSETGAVEAGADTGAPETGVEGGGIGDAMACNGSVVPQFVTKSLTLTRACSPWHAPLPVLVGDATNHPVLTVEPGVTVTFASGASLSIGMAQTAAAPGGLQAAGTAASPIVLTSDSASASPGAWGGVYFNPTATATSTLSHAVVKYAGQQFAPLLDMPVDLGSIYVDAGTASPLSNSTPLHILLSNLTVSNNGGSGIVFFGPYAGFAASSGALTITDWAGGGYPIVIDANSADTLPTTLTTGSGQQGGIGIIEEEANMSGGGTDLLIHDETWPAIPIPYIVDASDYSNTTGGCGLVVDGTAGATITLTIAAPNTVEFQKPAAGGAGGACGIYVSQNHSGGQLIANGTASAPIVFTSAQATPAPGDWAGITISSDTAAFGTTSFAYCTFSYATATTSAGSSELFFDGFAACLPGGGGPGTAGPPVTHCAFTNYAGCAIDGLDLLNEGTTYGASTTGTNGNTFTPASGNTAGVCTQKTC